MRSVRLLLPALLLVAVSVGGGSTGWARPAAQEAPLPPPLDSARAELEVGRAWHATRILRDAGVRNGPPEHVLLLARAESGWKNHDAVRELLEGADWLGRVGDGLGWALLARAREAEGAWREAAEAWASYLLTPAGEADAEAPALVVRRARALARAGAVPEATAILGSLSESDADLRSWFSLELARDAAEEGDTALVSALAGRITDPAAVDAGWRLVADARLAAGDTAGTIVALRTVRSRHPQGARHALAGVEMGLLQLARGDTAAAVGLLRASLEEAPSGAAGRAARALLAVDEAGLETTLRLAALMDRAGDGAGALRAYDRAWRMARDGGGSLAHWQRLARARLLSTVPSRRDEALEEFRALDEEITDPDLGARNLVTWMRMRDRQGRSAAVSTIRGWLLERYPGSDTAAEIVWDRAWSAEGGGRLDEALRHYAALAEDARTHSLAGRARMRMGQIHIGRGEHGRAAEVYDAYLEDFPDGRRWEEAAYWAAWSRMQAGDETGARARLERLRRDEPFSYYAVLAAELLGEPYRVSLPAGEAEVEPGWLTRGLERLDALAAAGLEDAAEAQIERLEDRAEGSVQVTLGLAEALIERGRTIEGINLGWGLRGDGHPWDARLARVVYPFPARELVEREARERGVDPMMMAALIRQESAFDEDIVSHAGAIGLMQVMPPTGRALARVHGPEGFQPESLKTGEVNLHLGTAYFVEMSDRYDGVLPLILSAYNAGPTRATRWRRYPEAGDWLRFTERIPFAETRGYVKNVRRNLGVYRELYGSD